MEAALSVDALGVGRASLRTVVGIGGALVNIGTKGSIASVPRVANTLDSRICRVASSVLGTNTVLGYRLHAVVNSYR